MAIALQTSRNFAEVVYIRTAWEAQRGHLAHGRGLLAPVDSSRRTASSYRAACRFVATTVGGRIVVGDRSGQFRSEDVPSMRVEARVEFRV